MSDEEKQIDVDEEIRKASYEKVANIEPALYWEWRATIEELNTARVEEKMHMLESKLKQTEIERQKLLLKLFSQQQSSKSNKRKKAEDECKRMKERLEEQIGFSLQDCVIDDVTFEVRKLSEN